MFTLIPLLLLLILLFIISTRSPSYFIVANIAIVPILATYDRLVGGIPVSFTIIKLPFYFLSITYLLIKYQKKSFITKKTWFFFSLYVIFAVVTFYMSLIRGTFTEWYKYELNSFGFIYIFLSFIIYITQMEQKDIIKTMMIIIKFIFLPIALFGIYQYIVGPEKIEQLGFTLITENTQSPYADKFAEVRRFNPDGLRPFSFLIASSSYAGVMVHACLWTLIFGMKRSKFIPRIVYILVFIGGLVTANFVTTILLTILGIMYYMFINLKYKSGYFINLKLISTFLIVVIMIPLLFPGIALRFLARTDLTFSTSSSSMNRIEMISNYAKIIKKVPFYGLGRGNMSNLAARMTADQRNIWNAIAYGIVSVILYYLLFIYFYLKAFLRFRQCSRSTDEWKIYLIIQIIFLLALIGDFGNGLIPQTSPSNIIFWFLGGIVFLNQVKSSDKIELSK